MLDCISVQTMRDSDRWTIANLTPSLELMHRAAMGVFRAVSWQGRTAILCGSGNNGGDGFALACILQAKGFDCALFTLSDRLSPDAAHYAALARQANIPTAPFTPGCLDGFDILVDCLLGTGFQGEVRDNYRAAIEAINAAPAYTVSVDINSGMNGDTGEGNTVVRSDLTVTIGYIKHGLVSQQAGAHIKRLVCAPIGIELTRWESKILGSHEAAPSEPEHPTIPCPPWLDMTPV